MPRCSENIHAVKGKEAMTRLEVIASHKPLTSQELVLKGMPGHGLSSLPCEMQLIAHGPKEIAGIARHVEARTGVPEKKAISPQKRSSVSMRPETNARVTSRWVFFFL